MDEIDKDPYGYFFVQGRTREDPGRELNGSERGITWNLPGVVTDLQGLVAT